MARCASYPNKLQDSLINNLWKESSDILDFLYGDINQKTIASEASSFGCLRPGLSLVQSDFRILGSSIFVEGIN